MTRRVVAYLLVVGSLMAGSGCLRCFYPVHLPEKDVLECCQEVPPGARSHVFIFLINGLDPCDLSNLGGVRDYLHTLGFPKTYYGQLYHAGYFEKELRRIHKEDRDARFVLIGFDYGANKARDIAWAVKDNDILIDLLVYLGGSTLHQVPTDETANACRVVNVVASDCLGTGAGLDHAENLVEPGVAHYGFPTHAVTLEVLARELAVVAAAVPVPKPLEPVVPPLDEEAPTPRPVKPSPAAQRDAWDFLKPVSRLKMPPHPEPKADEEKKAVPLLSEKVALRNGVGFRSIPVST